MHIDYLVRMANDIGAFFAHEEDQNVAANSIHLHFKRYWDLRMRGRIVEYFNETGGAELEGPVRTAVQRLAEETQKGDRKKGTDLISPTQVDLGRSGGGN